jgi:hypothetical protein
MKLLIAFILLVIVGSMWETQRNRRPGPIPLIAMCVVMAAGFFSVVRFL